MVDIIIVGCGVQSRAHIACYAKLKEMFDLNIAGVVDPDQKHLNAFQHLFNELGFDARGTLFKNKLSEITKELNISNSIVDILTPNNCHYPCAKEAIDMGVKRIIIEKPLAHDISDAMNIEKLSGAIGVVENYLFSSITQYIKKFIEEQKLKPLFIKTEFSKDRRVESSGGRGVSGAYSPHTFSIEIPHQVAVVSYILGFPERVCDAWCIDMLLSEGRIPNLGEGAITLAHKDRVASYNFSCLQGHRHLSTRYRTIRIYCEEAFTIFGYYPTTSDLEGTILVYRDQDLVERHKLIADSMTETLKYLINCCMANKKPFTDANFGRKIMEIIDTGMVLAKKFY
jgi:predicted dehydrogenase